jgi:hypothetical protein
MANDAGIGALFNSYAGPDPAEFGGTSSYADIPSAPTAPTPPPARSRPRAPSAEEGYRLLRLPNGGFVQIANKFSDEEALKLIQQQQPNLFATPEAPKHKAIPKGHAADEERPDPDFEQNLTRSKFEADDDQARKQKVINDVLLAQRQVPPAFRDQEAPLLPPTPAMEQVAAKRALTEKLAHRAIDAQYPIPQAFQGAPTNADIARANEAMIRPDPSKQGFLSGLESGAAGFVAGAPSAVATNLEALPFPLDEFGQQAAGAIRGAVAPMRQVEKEAHKPLSELELIEARNKGILPGAQAELTHAGDVMGSFLGKWGAPMLLGKAGAPGRAASTGLTYSLLFDEFDQRAKEAKIPMTLPELHAGAAISTALFQLAPTFITKGLPIGLIAPSAKTVAEIYRTQGPEAAQAAIGGITQNILKSAASGFVGATGAMVGTEAAQRQLLGQPQLTLDEAAQIAKDAGIITAFTAPFHGRGAREEGRRAYVQEAAKDIKQRIVDREADEAMRREGVRVDAEDINRQNAQRRWPGMSTEGAQGRDQAQGTEHIETPGVTEPAPPTGEINLLQPVDWHPTGDGFPNTVEGLKDFIAHHKDKLQNEVARRNPEVAAPINAALKEANKRLTALRRTAQKGEAPTPPGIPPSAETLPWPVTPEAEATTPGAEVPYYETLGLSPKNKTVRNALQSLDINNPEHHATIVQVLDNAIADPRLKVKDVDAMTALRDQLQPKEAPSAGEIEVTTPSDAGGEPQPAVLQEGEGAPVSGEGVPSGEPQRQEITGEGQAEEVEPQNPREAWEALRSEGDPDHKALPREAQIAWKRAFDDGAADKAFFDQLKTAITPEADRQAGETEEAVAPSKKDYDGDEFLYSKKADEETKPWWYSPVARVLKDAKIKRQTGKQWKGWLAGQEGVKKDELEHSGMNDFLDLIGDTQIEKGELEHFIGKHGVDIEETQLVDESLPEHPEERHEALMQYPTYARYHGMLEEVRAALKQGTREHREVLDEFSDALEQNDGPRVDWLRGKAQELEDILKSGAEAEEQLIAMRNSAEDDIVMGLPKSARFRKHTFRKGSKNYLEMLLRLPQKIGESVKFVYDTHYDDPNVLAFVRGTTRDNGKTFFVEELQSDWGQRGQKRGFLEKGEPIPRHDVKAIREEIREAERARDAAYDEWDTAIKAENARYEEVDRALVKQMREGMPYAERAEIAEKRTEERSKHYAKWKELSEAFDVKKDAIDAQLSALHAESRNALHGTGKVPKAPFIGDSEGWTALGLKKIIQHAIAQGHDRVTFINGRQSAMRWNERQLATRVVYDAEGTLRGYDVDGDLIYDKSVKEPNLAAVLSPKAAEELLAQEPELGVRTLKKPTYIGGEGLIRHYDQTIPKVLNKVLNNLLKGSGTKIELERVVQPDVSDFEGQGDTQLSFKITPELRAAVEKGIPLFAKKKAQGELHTVETLQKELGRLYGKDVPEIEVSTREKEGVDEKTQGFFDPKTNRAVLIADNIGKGEDIHGLMRHEVAVHLKKLGATDEEFQGFLRQLEALRDNGAKDIVEAFERVPKGTNPEKVTEEAMAYLAQNKPNLPIVRRFMSWLRRNAYKISGSEKWLKGDDFAVMADEVLRTKVERPMTEGERMETRTPEEEVPLVTSERKSMVKAVGNAVKRIVSAAIDPRALSKEYTKFTQQVVAESRGLTKALEAQPTYDPDTGIRADYLRNQYDSAYQLTLEGLFGGVPIMEKGTGVARIQPSTRLNVDRIMADTAKLPLTRGHDGKKQDPLTVMAEIFRIKLGEMERKELTQVVRRLEAIRALPAASRQTRDAKAEIAKLRKLIQEPRERRVTQEMVDWANQQIRDTDGVQDILDRWAETNQHLLAFERDTGFISQERYDELADRTAYIPLFMPMEEILERRGEMPAFPGGGPKSTGKEYSKSGRGSLMAVNVWENMAKRYSAAIANGMMNNVKLRAYEQLKALDLAERVAPTYRGHDAVKARMDGKDFLFRVKDEDAYRSLTMAGMYSNPWLDLIAIPANWVRRSALFLNPAYYVRSLVTEPVTATMTTMAKGAVGPVTPIDALYQIGKRIVGKNKSAKEMQSYGITGLSHLDQNMYRFSRALGESPKFNKWMQYLDKVHSAIDDATRTIIYESAQKDAARDGITDPQIIKDIAAVKARDFADFAAKGSSQMVRVAGKQTPFLHAHFVGMDKFLRAATGYGQANKEGDKQKQRFINMAVLGASSVVGLTLLNAQDKRYRELPIGEWSKNFILGFDEDGRAIKMPISQEVGFIKFMAELMTRMLVGVSDQPEANKAFHGMAIDTLLPPGLADPVSVATRGWLQMQTNTELHSGLPIVSPQEMLGLPEDQDERATYFSKKFRDMLKEYKLADNFSPELMDSIFRSYLTAIYDNAALTASMIFDANAQKRGVFDLPYNKDFTEVYPGARVIFGSPRNISDMPRFYEMSKPLYQTLQSFNRAANADKPDSEARFEEMRNDPVIMQRVAMAKTAEGFRKDIAALEKENEKLFLDKDLTEAQRRKLYWQNVEEIKETARKGVEALVEGLQEDKKYQDVLKNSWKLSVSPEDIERTISDFDNLPPEVTEPATR